MKYDDLSIRMKSQYEDRSRYYVPRRTYTILRLDGCHWHTFTRGLKKPFDKDLMEDMNRAVIATLPQIQGAVFAYLQSDEISILLTDFADINTNAWFDGNIQKISSVAASILSVEFNRIRWMRDAERLNDMGLGADNRVCEGSSAYFDCRCFTIPDRIEVMNYFRWRNQDCARNAISMVANSLFSHKELDGKSGVEKIEMIKSKGKDFEKDFTEDERHGRVILKGGEGILPFTVENVEGIENGSIKSFVKIHWRVQSGWNFSKDDGKLLSMIPKYDI